MASITIEMVVVTRAHSLMLLGIGKQMPPGWYWRIAGRERKSPLDGYTGPFPSEKAIEEHTKALVDAAVKDAQAKKAGHG